MVCRETQIGSAVTSLVIQTTPLEEQQVLSLYHELMRESGQPATAPLISRQVTQGILIDVLEQDLANASLSPARQRSIHDRLRRAREEDLTPQRRYATARLRERAIQASQSLDVQIEATARALGITENEARQRLADLREEARADRSLRAPREFIDELRSDPGTASLPLDRQTAYALHRLHTQRAQRQATARTEPTVQRETIHGSAAVASMGHDPISGRCEVTMHSSPDRVYAYRMTAEEYQEFRHAGSIGSYFATNVRSNPEYRYDTAEEHLADGTRYQCATCGQFAGRVHSCPVRGSVDERAVSTQQAIDTARAARAAATGAPAPAPTAAPRPLDLTPLRRRLYVGDSGGLTIPNVTGVRQHARNGRSQNRPVLMPVNSVITNVSRTQGPTPTTRQRVEGAVEVRYRGRGRGYEVVAHNSDGNRSLRCDCPVYQANYDCEHVRQTIQDLNTRLNMDAQAQRTPLGPALEQVNAELAQDHAESVDAQTRARDTWDTSESVSYTEDHTAFQGDYNAARDRAAAGEPPIPYMRENATDGLGSRDGGRAFGIEIEFDVEPGRDRGTVLRNIGAALHREGLTRTATQQPYHSVERRGYTENHQGGWAFESDCTVHGEIVSPIMYDEPQTWNNIEKVMRIVRENGGIATTRTGAHVHVSAHNYDHTVENHNRLLNTFAENEDLIYRLSANPERGQHRGSRWCAPNSVPSTGYRDVRDAQYRNSSHGLGVNMQSVAGRESDHVEFRTFDGSLDPSVMQTQIKLALGITESAFRDTTQAPTGARTPIGSHRAHNRAEHGARRRLTGEAWRQDTAGFRALADRIFRRREDKAQLTALFQQTKWSRGTR